MEIPVSHHLQLIYGRRSRVCRNLFEHVRGGGTASKSSIVVAVGLVVLLLALFFLVVVLLLMLFFVLTLVVIVVVTFLLVAFPWFSTFLATTSLLFVGFRHPTLVAQFVECGVYSAVCTH